MSYGMNGWNKPDGDLISRAVAINEFDGAKVDEECCTEYDIGYNDGINFAISRLSVLSSAQPERKKGKWHQRFYSKVEMMVCSECGNEFSYDAETGLRDYNFCPNCGADMRGEDNGDQS